MTPELERMFNEDYGSILCPLQKMIEEEKSAPMAIMMARVLNEMVQDILDRVDPGWKIEATP